MPTVTLSSKHQITLPVEIVRTMGLKPGDKLIAEALDWRIVIMKESENRLERYIGSLRGVYGKTVEEIDRYVREERASPERQEWEEEFYDLVATEPNVEMVVTALRTYPHYVASVDDLLQAPTIRAAKLHLGDVQAALKKLVNHGAVREIPLSGLVIRKYRLVREFAKPVLVAKE